MIGREAIVVMATPLGYSGRTTEIWVESWRGSVPPVVKMEEPSAKSVTRLLQQWRLGDESAMRELVPHVYDELRRLARMQLRGEGANCPLQPTELVHEAYARLVNLELSWQDRVHFFSMAARTMRRVLVDCARARLAEKRGGSVVMVSLSAAQRSVVEVSSDILDLSASLDRLAVREERLSQAIELFYFGGLGYREIGLILDVSPTTIDRDLRFARAWLRRELAPDGEGGNG